MGNKNGSARDVLIRVKTQIAQYTPGDVEEFEKIVQSVGNTVYLGPSYKAWKLGCLYHFLVTLDPRQHDIGESQAKIIGSFTELEAGAMEDAECDNPERSSVAREVLYHIFLATGNKKYLNSKSSVKFMV